MQNSDKIDPKGLIVLAIIIGCVVAGFFYMRAEEKKRLDAERYNEETKAMSYRIRNTMRDLGIQVPEENGRTAK